MKQKIVILIVATVALLTFGQTYASQVTNVELSYSGGFTIARISVEGQIRFTHQTEVAKDGKPFRVIVDVLSATHDLGAQTFTFLPDCPVRSIRSSQYSVNPERVVRIVFDMDSERVYRVESDSKYISIYFSDNVPRTFVPWSTAAYVAGQQKSEEIEQAPKVAASEPTAAQTKTATELNSAINKDRLSSLDQKPEDKPSAPVVSTEPKATAGSPQVSDKSTPTVSKPAPKTVEQPYGPSATLADIKSPAKEVKPAEAKTPVSTVAELENKPVAAPAQVDASKPAESSVPPQAPLNTTPVVASATEPEQSESKAVQAPVEQPTEADTLPAVEMNPNPSSVTAQQAGNETETNDISTSKFRRAPAESRKIKGTLVAEFPQRLVIKYQTSGYRDPFETLINDSKVDNNPIEKQIPNVEGLKLVGIIESSGGSDNRALFEDGDGYGYILATGDKVQKGYVLKVDSDRVYFQIFEYGWSRTVALNLESKS